MKNNLKQKQVKSTPVFCVQTNSTKKITVKPVTGLKIFEFFDISKPVFYLCNGQPIGFINP